MHQDHIDYYKFTSRSRFNKAVNSLLGIIEGISADSIINNSEIKFILSWIDMHKAYRNRHPFNELIPIVSNALSDGILSDEERDDIIWLCEKLRSTDYYDIITADIQRLHSIMGAIVSDGIITEMELRGLSEWLYEHEHLRRCWPYDEVESVITSVLADGKIDNEEHEFLKEFFGEFLSIGDNRAVSKALVSSDTTIQGLCSVCPSIIFKNSIFCFTGSSCKYTRKQFFEIVMNLGGKVTNYINPKIDYLIIGADGNPCWAYACYGRKVEEAVNLRKQGHRLLIVHENDFNDAIEDAF